MSDVQTAPRPVEGDLRLVSAMVYGLFLFSIPTHGLSTLIGVVIAYVKRGDARGTVFESHFSNAITVFWATAIFWVLMIGAAIAGVATMFTLYGPDVWHWHVHAHEWTARMHEWRAGMHDHVLPQEWWPAIGFLPLIPLVLLAFSVWWLYRVIRGLVHALENKAY